MWGKFLFMQKSDGESEEGYDGAFEEEGEVGHVAVQHQRVQMVAQGRPNR